ncbi:hypothetical protein DM02DRAFT_611118 [Periconia macrospinosa]|uniref:Uncharacterized protein n=1 Tax=Periconia macrospinosa TaxID=97972 RepID=A0A2V1E3V8_9PLEO|nr:hypothetical protein DM02DRAFT_611118 [Periconia macrospinosa]
MVASLTMSQAPCAWPNERDSKPINNNYQKRASSRRKNINKATQSKAKNNKNNRATKDESDSGVRVGCPYYIKDPNKHHNTLSCRGAGFKEVAKLRYDICFILKIPSTLLPIHNPNVRP